LLNSFIRVIRYERVRLFSELSRFQESKTVAKFVYPRNSLYSDEVFKLSDKNSYLSIRQSGPLFSTRTELTQRNTEKKRR